MALPAVTARIEIARISSLDMSIPSCFTRHTLLPLRQRFWLSQWLVGRRWWLVMVGLLRHVSSMRVVSCAPSKPYLQQISSFVTRGLPSDKKLRARLGFTGRHMGAALPPASGCGS
jgi:hypothetical protein